VTLRRALRTGAALAAGAAWWWALPGVGHGGLGGVLDGVCGDPGAGVVLAGGWALGLVPLHATRPGPDDQLHASRAPAEPEEPLTPGPGPADTSDTST
jgi:hypothetical protein